MGVKIYGCIRSLLASILLNKIITSSTLVLPPSGEICPVACSCGPTTVTCNKTIPTVVPDNIIKVEIDDLPTDTLRPNVFCNVKWPRVITLWLSLRFSSDLSEVLDNYVFSCLLRIQNLKISGLMWQISQQTFYGLDNMTDLDISGNSAGRSVLLVLLNFSANLPRLTYFNLSNCNEMGPCLQWTVDQDIIDFLSIRPIKLLDLSRNFELTFNFQNTSGLCQTLQTLIIHDSQINCLKKPSVGYCKSLQFVDLSGNQEFAYGLKTCVNRDFLWSIFDFLCAPKIRLDRLITDATGCQTRNCKFWLDCDPYVRQLYFTNNFIPNFEILFNVNDLEFIDLSNNNIKNINKLALANIETLKTVDLSHNKLGQMGDFEDVLSSLFLSNPYLSSVHLAFNELSHLPGDTFISNSNITEIILAHNNFEQLSLNFTHLLNLTVLDLRFNKMQYLDRHSMKLVDEVQMLRHNSHQLRVLLEGNPFTCSCLAKEFLQWFVTSPIHNTTYTCHLDRETVPMTEAAVRAAQEDCERPGRRLMIIMISIITPTIVCAVSVAAGIVLYKQYKRRLKQQRLQDRLHLIQEDGTGFKFTVFLAYSSRDVEFVVEHIRQPLERHLRILTNTDREHVCDADLHFIPGHPIFQEMERCIAESAVFVAVISENFCNSFFCQDEISEAQSSGKPIILIFKELICETTMGSVIKNIFKNYVRAKIVQDRDGYQIYPGWENLCKAIIGQIKVQ